MKEIRSNIAATSVVGIQTLMTRNSKGFHMTDSFLCFTSGIIRNLLTIMVVTWVTFGNVEIAIVGSDGMEGKHDDTASTNKQDNEDDQNGP